MVRVYKRYSFRSIFTGERTWHPSYLCNVIKDAEHDLMDFIYEDISHDGSGFDVETGERKMVFFRDDMYGTKIEYTWKEE